MRFIYSNPAAERALAGAKTFDALEPVLRGLRGLVGSFLAPEVRGRQIFWPGIDALIPRVAEQLGLKDVALVKGDENNCIVATRFYPVGGHSKVGSDIARLIGAERMILLFTDADSQLRWRGVINTSAEDALYHRRATLLMSAPTLVEKVVELYMTLAAIRPSRIFLLANHMDAVATIACWPFRDVVEFVHHADYMPALGVTLPWSAHIDLTYTCHQACKEAGLHPVYAGMTLEDADTSLAAAAPADGPRRIATCGSLQKYRHPALYRWSDFVVAALAPNAAEFVHIGPYDDAFTADMRAALEAAGIDPARYRFTGPLPDLRRALAAEGIDTYLSSYPDGGGRAALEVIAAGVVPIVPIPLDQGPLVHFGLPLDSWVRVTEPGQMADAMARAQALRPALLGPEGQAALARELSRFAEVIAGRAVA